MYVEFDCEVCGKHIRRQQAKGMTHRFCSKACKGEWQRTQKPVSKEWLHEKYVVEGLDCNQIAKLVNRDPKRVWEWLKDYDIPTRKRGTTGNHVFSSGMKGKHHSESTREKIRQVQIDEGRVPYLKDGVHHMKGKRGTETTNWKGGVTPQRQKVYDSPEWKNAVKAVWKRDNATCQRCGLHRSQAPRDEVDFDIHHIVSFAVAELRCEPSNLVLLCEPCHYWVHSKANTNKEFIHETNSDGF